MQLSDLQNKLSQVDLIDCKLGENKIIKIRKLNGNDINTFNKELVKLKTNQDLVDIIKNILIIPVIQEHNFYLTDEELFYIFTIIREHSSSKVINYSFICTEEDCNAEYNIEIPEFKRNTRLYKNGEIDLKNGLVITIGDMVNPKLMYSKAKKGSDILTELLMRTKELKYNGEVVEELIFNDLYTLFSNLDHDIFDALLTTYTEEFVFYDEILPQKCICNKCGAESEIILNDVTVFLSGLI